MITGTETLSGNVGTLRQWIAAPVLIFMSAVIFAGACVGSARTASPVVSPAAAAPPAMSPPGGQGRAVGNPSTPSVDAGPATMRSTIGLAAPDATIGPPPLVLPPARGIVLEQPSQEVVPLAWVNPARCLAPCGFDPGRSLQRIDQFGALDPRGKHRVEATALEPLTALLSAARDAGYSIRITSAFRSYRDQVRVFRTTKERGRAARPGHSEHQLGTAIDLRLSTATAISWLADHAFEYGFVLSYPGGKQRLTGYRPEPWHIRFVGRDMAGDLRRRGWTLEDLFRARPEMGESGNCADCPVPISRTACGPTTTVGTCRGDVLTWCYDGALAAVDCTLSDQTCQAGAGASLSDCR